MVSESLANAVHKGDLGTTFGAGPLACALVETVVDHLGPDTLAHVRHISQKIRSSCCVGPVTDVQGMGLLLGLRTTRPAREVLTALRERHILAGSSGDPHVVRLLPPLVLQQSHVDALALALSEIEP
jgi:acetylornithine/succinyldiaminopimelate/putrescine aminotransferase